MNRTGAMTLLVLLAGCSRDLDIPAEPGPGASVITGKIVALEALTGERVPVKDASIELLGTAITTTSGEEGFFSLAPEAGKPWQLLARSGCDAVTRLPPRSRHLRCVPLRR